MVWRSWCSFAKWKKKSLYPGFHFPGHALCTPYKKLFGTLTHDTICQTTQRKLNCCEKHRPMGCQIIFYRVYVTWSEGKILLKTGGYLFFPNISLSLRDNLSLHDISFVKQASNLQVCCYPHKPETNLYMWLIIYSLISCVSSSHTQATQAKHSVRNVQNGLTTKSQLPVTWLSR